MYTLEKASNTIVTYKNKSCHYKIKNNCQHTKLIKCAHKKNKPKKTKNERKPEYCQKISYELLNIDMLVLKIYLVWMDIDIDYDLFFFKK